MALPPVIDACVFHEWPSIHALAPYMSPGWRELVLRPDDPAGPNQAMSNWRLRSPVDRKAEDAYPESGAAGSSPELTIAQLFDDGSRERAVLHFDEGIRATAHSNHFLARLMARAANDWTIEEWLPRDERLFATILVATVLPNEAAAEIRRVGEHPQIVGVALGANGLARPFGHPVYHPIYEACAELGLPVVVQAGSDAATDALTKPVAGGIPTTYAEAFALSGQPAMTHVASMIGQGVFDLFPGLDVLVVGGGVAWIPAYLWRYDYWYRVNGRECPWLRMLPSEYFREHVYIAGYSLEAPEPKALAALLQTVPGIDKRLVYASCYPNVDGESPTQFAERLPEAWADGVLHDNAHRLFRWPGTRRERLAAVIDATTLMNHHAGVAAPAGGD